jgi:flagellar FliL protein
MKKLLLGLCALWCLSPLAHAQDAPDQMVGYVSLDPEIVTNYISESNNKLGFIRVTIELMVKDVALLPDVENHLPLLRSVVIEFLGQQPESKIKSQLGRKDIELELLQALNSELQVETGTEAPIKMLIFTKYLFQQ